MNGTWIKCKRCGKLYGSTAQHHWWNRKKCWTCRGVWK